MVTLRSIDGRLQRVGCLGVALGVSSILATLLPTPTPAAGLIEPMLRQQLKPQTVRLDVKPGVVAPGQRIRIRVVNHGATAVVFGEPFSIQRRVATGWRRASFSPKGPWPEDQLQLPPGRTGEWQSLRIPVMAAPGRYRAIKTIETNRSSRHLTAAFRVAASGPSGKE